MQMKKDVIGEVTVEVKAGLSVDEQTFNVCLNLIQIYVQNKGFGGFLVGYDSRCEMPFHKEMSEEEVDVILHGRKIKDE